eukprot:1765987-Pyramimonas_sp.AAC.1
MASRTQVTGWHPSSRASRATSTGVDCQKQTEREYAGWGATGPDLRPASHARRQWGYGAQTQRPAR